jgi:hypothetical protein
VHKIAEAAPVAFTVLILATARFTEVGYRRELRIEWATWRQGLGIILIRTYFGRTGVPPLVEIIDSCLSFGFPFITRINIANEVVTDIVTDLETRVVSFKWDTKASTDMKLKKIAKLAQFTDLSIEMSATPSIIWALGGLLFTYQYKSSKTASKPSCNSFSLSLQLGSFAGLW